MAAALISIVTTVVQKYPCRSIGFSENDPCPTNVSQDHLLCCGLNKENDGNDI